MTYIAPNTLYPSDKIIKPYECAMIAIEGPNIKGKLNLEGLEIKYDSYNSAQMTLNPLAKDQPLLYGFLGNNITCLLIRANFYPMDPMYAIEIEQYLEYYYADDPTRIRTMGQLLFLTGNSAKRIPQIYLNNPSTRYKVQLEIIMANLGQDSLVNPNQFKDNSYFNGLYYNSIISDSVNYITPTSTGSTELKIIDINGNALIYIPYSNIRSVEKINSLTLLIGLDTEEKVKLEFLSEFNTDQANSRINWVLISQRYRTLTVSNPSIDTTPPVFTWNSVLSGTTTDITYNVTGTTINTIYVLHSGITYTATDLQNIFISSITDNVDGSISIYDSEVFIHEFNDIVPVSGMTDVGIYNVIYYIKDIANNKSKQQMYVAIVDGTGNSGYFLNNITWVTVNIKYN